MKNTVSPISATPDANDLFARMQGGAAVMRKRRSYISSPETQHRIVRQFMFVLGVGIILGLSNAYVIASFSHVEIVVLPDATPLETTLALIYMASLAMASLGVVLLLALFCSHRVGGPVFKIVAALQNMAGGDLRGRVRLRDTDLLQDVALATNEAAMNFQRALRRVDASVGRLRREQVRDPVVAESLAEIEAVLEEFGALTPAVKETPKIGSTHGKVMSLQR